MAQLLLLIAGKPVPRSVNEMNVSIVPDKTSQPTNCNDYVRVSTVKDPFDDTVTLATIQRIIENDPDRGENSRQFIKTIVLKQPMSSDAAVGLAACYAERKNISCVVTD